MNRRVKTEDYENLDEEEQEKIIKEFEYQNDDKLFKVNQKSYILDSLLLNFVFNLCFVN